MISNHILSNFLIFRSQTDSDKRCERGDVTKDVGGKEVEAVGGISVKIKLTAFCLHLTLFKFNQVQADVHVDFC